MLTLFPKSKFSHFTLYINYVFKNGGGGVLIPKSLNHILSSQISHTELHINWIAIRDALKFQLLNIYQLTS